MTMLTTPLPKAQATQPVDRGKICSAVQHTYLNLPAAWAEVTTAVWKSSWRHQVLKHETVLYTVEPCSLVGCHRCLRGACCLYLQGWSEQGKATIWFMIRLQGRWPIRSKDGRKDRLLTLKTVAAYSSDAGLHGVTAQGHNLNFCSKQTSTGPGLLNDSRHIHYQCCDQVQWQQCHTWSIQKVMRPNFY
jgi:hypothetical protein